MSIRLWTGVTNTDVNTNTNYSATTIPVSGDDLYVQTSAVSMAASLSALSGVTLSNLIVGMSMTGAIGTTAAYLQISATNWRFGDPGGASQIGASNGLSKLNFGSNAFTGVVLNSSTSSTETGLEPLRILGTSASNALYVIGGRVGVATTSPTETSTLNTFSVTGANAALNIGNGVTLNTGYQSLGALTINSGMTSFSQAGGTATLRGTGNAAVRTLSVGGICYNNQRPLILSASGITRSSTTATLTSASHGYSAGDTIYISGANETNYDGYFVITNITTNTFDYTVSSVAPTPATGTITCVKAIASLSITNTGTADFSQDSRDVYVAAITIQPGGTLKFSPANPAHLHYGSNTPANAGNLAAS